MPSATTRRRSSSSTLPLRLPVARGERGQADPLPSQGEKPERNNKEEGAAPPDEVTEKAAKRGSDGCRNRVTRIQHGQGPGHHVFGDKPHDDGRGHRPEAANGNAEQRTADHEQCIVGSEGYNQAGDNKKHGEAGHDEAPVDTARKAGDKKARQNCKCTGYRDSLTRLSFTDPEVCRHGRQKADRHEFGSDQTRRRKAPWRTRRPRHCGSSRRRVS